jgi:hypothetical protein
MGYNFHVTRKEYRCDEAGPEITLDEWISYVHSDVEVRPDPDTPGHEKWLGADVQVRTATGQADGEHHLNI